MKSATIEPLNSAIELLKCWAKPVPEMGEGVYRLTNPPGDHKHSYHVYCPWSPDGRHLLLFRYNRTDPAGEVCVMGTASGKISVVGNTRRWGCHNAARQQWAGNRIFYPAESGPDGSALPGGPEGAEDSGSIFVTVAPDGSDERTLRVEGITAPFVSPDGKWVYGGSTLPELFPDDAISPRTDKGLFRINMETGQRELVLSLDKALALLPNAKEAEPCHIYLKMFVVHPRIDRVMMVITNTFWELDGKEPRIRAILSTGLGGEDPTFVGYETHHPNWHPIHNQVVANTRDCNGKLRFVLYPGDGEGLVDYVPRTEGSGHPSFSPDGRWLCTDGSGPLGDKVIFCDPKTGASTVGMRVGISAGGAYRSFSSVRSRPAGETVTQALERCCRSEGETWLTQCHAVWSRDGSAVLANFDGGDGSQLYAIDATRLE